VVAVLFSVSLSSFTKAPHLDKSKSTNRHLFLKKTHSK
jgi:hypothetical protein